MVDRIGKGGAPPPAAGPTGPAPSEQTGKTFDVHGTEAPSATRAASQVAAPSVTALDQLKAGKIDLNGYLDLKVHEATAHLQGLTPAHLDSVKSMLRDRMATDPELVDLVKQATGNVPNLPDE
jgi:hypothetical protein